MGLLIPKRRSRWYLAAVSLVCGLGSGGLLAQVANEYEVKAAFLCKFASFVDWPDGIPAAAGGHRCIGVVGDDPFGPVLDEVAAGKFAVHRFKPGQESEECQIVFVAASERRRLRTLFDRLRGEAVLTVSDMPGFCEQGGIINLEVAEHRIALQVNPEAAGRARLQVSSRLLSVARIVHDASPAGRGKP